MSAFMVSQEHVRVLVWAADLATDGRGIDLSGIPSKDFPNPSREIRGEEAGKLLWEANAASLFALYGHVVAESYQHAAPRFCSWSELELLEILACFEYQSCEVSDWHERAAFWWCYHLRKRLISMMVADVPIDSSITTDSVPLYV